MTRSFKDYMKIGTLSALVGLYGCGKSEVAPFITKLPDKGIKIEYEKMVESPFKTAKKCVDGIRPCPWDSNDVNALFWFENENELKRYDHDLDGDFFQRVNYKGKKTESKSIMNPKDGIPEIFVVPRYKEIVSGDRDHLIKGFSANIFVDEDYLKASKNNSLYFWGDKNDLRLIRPLKFKKEVEIYFDKIDTEDIVTRCKNNYCLKKDKESSKGAIIEARYPRFAIGDFEGENPKLESKDLKNPLYALFGMFYSNGIFYSLDDQKALAEKMALAKKDLDYCFDDSFQAKLTVAYDTAQRQNPGSASLSIPQIRTEKGCMFYGARQDISFENGEGKIFVIKGKFMGKDSSGNPMISSDLSRFFEADIKMTGEHWEIKNYKPVDFDAKFH